LLGRVSLRQRKWNCTDSKKKQQIKRASDKVRFDGGINLFFHELVPRDL
jgi:hypothetical protein